VNFDDDLGWCPIISFENWLVEQFFADSPDSGYLDNCQAASSLPVPESALHSCMISFVEAAGYNRIYHRDGKVEIIRFPYIHKGKI
jgi:hypothetical protein